MASCCNVSIEASFVKGHDFSQAENDHKKKPGFTGCGKTRLERKLSGLCNQGTTLVGPQLPQNEPGLQPLPISHCPNGVFPQTL
jgi:hypothetical protein